MIGICAICETEHELKLLAEGEEENMVWEDYLCPVTSETFTHLHNPIKYVSDACPVCHLEHSPNGVEGCGNSSCPSRAGKA